MWEIHKYEKGVGHYESWHTEGSQLFDFGNRMFVSMFYLNDVEEGGTTDFLHQKVSLKPTKGSLVIFPANWMYVHRGAPPISGEKWIMNLWLMYSKHETLKWNSVINDNLKIKEIMKYGWKQ